eukprot:TRINITY_DN308_c0_g2_i1.p2 TRINITY_DN308_c0_g2~~TRINITY_DN308_c0_g2_i1.p2  ORF type:complete len:564 (-),score=168.08 TRINITY_DN308_c0_g2_i1:2084-3775(-)
MLTKQQKKKNQLGGYELLSRSTHTAAIERRSWEPWTDKENLIFFDSLSRNSRNWAEIARDVGTKRQEQVRTYYYRVLRRISKTLLSVNYNLDNRDRVATLVAMLAYWSVHTAMPTVEETTMEFAQALKDRIFEQKAPAPVAAAPARNARAAEPAPLAPSPEKVVIQLVPKSTDISEAVAEAGFNPRLQLTFKSKRSIANIVDHVTKKWVHADGMSVAKGSPIRLCTLGQSNVSGWDWGMEDGQPTILEIYQNMGCPPTIKLEYYWSGAPSADQDQEVEEVDDEEFEQKPISKVDSVFEPSPFVHPLAQQYSTFESHNIFEMDPVANQLSAMNLLADPFDEANSISVDADAHFEPITADDDDDLMLGFDDQASTESMLSEEATAIDSPVALPEPVIAPAPAVHMPRVIFTTKPKAIPQTAPVAKPITSLTSSINLMQPRAATPSPFPATPVALNMSYGSMSNGQGMIQADSFFNIDSDPVFDSGDNTTAALSSYGLDPLENSPSDDTSSFLASSPQTPLRSKALKQHERPLATLDGSDADDEDYCYAFNHFTTPKRPRMDSALL